jgi:hypothetical protein
MELNSYAAKLAAIEVPRLIAEMLKVVRSS